MSKSKIGVLFPDKKSATSAIGATSAKKAAGMPKEFKKHGIEIRIEYLEKLKDIAWQKRKRLRDVLDDALRGYLESRG